MDALEPALRRLTADAVLTGDQAAAVRAAVARERGAGGAPGEDARMRRRVPPWVEAVGYLGGVLAAAAAVVAGSEVWELLERPAQVALLTLASVVLWLAGRWIIPARGDEGDAPTDRLAGFLWLLSTVAASGAAAVLVGEGSADEWEHAVLWTGLVGAAHGGALWWRRPRALQLVGLSVPVAIAAEGALLLFEAPPTELYGLLLWALGVAWLLLAWGGVLRPPRAAYALGALAAVVAAEILIWESEALGLGLGLLTVVGLFAATAPARQPALSGIASAAVAVFVPQALSHWFPDTVNAPALTFVVGVLLLGGALATMRSAQRRGEGEGEGTPAAALAGEGERRDA